MENKIYDKIIQQLADESQASKKNSREVHQAKKIIHFLKNEILFDPYASDEDIACVFAQKWGRAENEPNTFSIQTLFPRGLAQYYGLLPRITGYGGSPAPLCGEIFPDIQSFLHLVSERINGSIIEFYLEDGWYSTAYLNVTVKFN